MAWAGAASETYRDERAWWHWLARNAGAGEGDRFANLPVFMGTGSEDRFLKGQKLLSELIPAERLRYSPGTHGWPTWLTLWSDWLDLGALAAKPSASSGSAHP